MEGFILNHCVKEKLDDQSEKKLFDLSLLFSFKIFFYRVFFSESVKHLISNRMTHQAFESD